jgi:hypothetical protein
VARHVASDPAALDVYVSAGWLERLGGDLREFQAGLAERALAEHASRALATLSADLGPELAALKEARDARAYGADIRRAAESFLLHRDVFELALAMLLRFGPASIVGRLSRTVAAIGPVDRALRADPSLLFEAIPLSEAVCRGVPERRLERGRFFFWYEPRESAEALEEAPPDGEIEAQVRRLRGEATRPIAALTRPRRPDGKSPSPRLSARLDTRRARSVAGAVRDAEGLPPDMLADILGPSLEVWLEASILDRTLRLRVTPRRPNALVVEVRDGDRPSAALDGSVLRWWYGGACSEAKFEGGVATLAFDDLVAALRDVAVEVDLSLSVDVSPEATE